MHSAGIRMPAPRLGAPHEPPAHPDMNRTLDRRPHSPERSGSSAPADATPPKDGKTPSHRNPGGGMLKKATAADRGLVEVPALLPHLEFRPVDDRQVLLISETFNTLLRGSIYPDLLPLLDGRHSFDAIMSALSGAHAASQIQTALASLISKQYVVSGDHAMDRGTAAFWSSLGASPRWAEERLQASKVAVAGDDGSLARQLGTAGIAVDADGPTLSAVVCADYLDERHASVNRRHLESGAPWMLIRPKGMAPLFGPVFRPAEQGPCWNCLAYRLRSHQEVHNFVRNMAGNDGAFAPFAAAPAVLEAIYGLAAVEIAKWLVLGKLAPLHEHAISLDVASLKSERHPVMRRPQCFACGDEALYRADRPPVPVRLRPSPKGVRNSGGARSVPPEETLAKYRHLISSVSGVVSWLTRTTDDTDTWSHVYWAGSNLALRSKQLSSLRRGLRSASAGKGSTAKQSEASALCEAIERYSNMFHGDEIRCRRSYADFVRAGEEEAIHPNEVHLFSDRQLDQADAINARGHPYNWIPPRLDPDAELDWSPVWSLTQGRPRYLPTSVLYSVAAEQAEGTHFRADSNGCAAGNTLEEAIFQGLFELLERDAFAIWWYNRLRVPGVDLDSFGDDYLAAARDYYRRFQRDLWVLDITGDFGIPTFVAVSRRIDQDEEDIVYGIGAHMDPHITALRAVCEMNQFLYLLQGTQSRSFDYKTYDPVSRAWWATAKLAEHAYLQPDPAVPLRRRADYAVPESADTREDVERYRALLEAKGMELLVLDQTRPDIGMPVARVVVPGLRHFWERFAPGRLYDVPVAMGRREQPLAEDELNPSLVIA